MGVKMIWPYDRAGLSLISLDLRQNKAPRRKRGTQRKETLTPEGLSWTNQNPGAGLLEPWLGRIGEVSRGADPCSGPRGESHCHKALMGPKIPPLTKTCERLRNERHLWFKLGLWGLYHEVCSWKSFSEETNTLPIPTRISQPRVLFATISHFHILTSQNCGIQLGLLQLEDKSGFYLKNELLNLFGCSTKRRGRVGKPAKLHDLVFFFQRPYSIHNLKSKDPLIQAKKFVQDHKL